MDFPAFQTYVYDWLALMKFDMNHKITIINEVLVSTGICVFVCILQLVFLIHKHLLHWKKPREQKRIIAIVLIPSILSTASFIELKATDDCKILFLLLDCIKDCSVGLGIAMFLSLMYAYMNINAANLTARDIQLKIQGRVIWNVFPVTLFQPRYVILNENNLKLHKYWTWQFVVIRLVCCVLMMVLQLLDIYPNCLSWAFFLISNVSLSLAFYTTYAFYQTFFRDFASHAPGEKFCYLKGIIFICFCQGGVLKVLVAMGIIKSNHFWQQELQNSLVNLEMLFFTFFQGISYSSGPYGEHLPLLHIRNPKISAHKLKLPKLAATAA